MKARVKGPGCMHRAPASVLTMLREFQKEDDQNFGGKTIRIVKHDRIDAKGKEVSGCFVWLDVVGAVLPGEVVAVSADIAPSLGYVDDGHGRPLAVVHPSDLNKAFTKHMEMASVLVPCNDAPVQRVQVGVGGVAGSVQALTQHTVERGMLPENAFKVESKDQCMYGRLMRDINIGGFSVLSDAQIRFRARDHKPLTGDLLVAVGRYVRVNDAQEAVKKMFLRKDHKVYDLQSLEFDNKLTEDPVCRVFDTGINGILNFFVPHRHLPSWYQF